MLENLHISKKNTNFAAKSCKDNRNDRTISYSHMRSMELS